MDKIKGLILVIIIIAFVFVLAIFRGGKSKSQNGYTANKGETLNVVEIKNDLSFEVSLESIENDYRFSVKEGLWYSEYGPYTKVDLKIKNNSEKEMDFSQIWFNLLDENDKSLGPMYSIPAGIVGASEAKVITKEKISKAEIKTGSIYFKNIEKNASKLEIKVLYDKNKPNYAESYYINIE